MACEEMDPGLRHGLVEDMSHFVVRRETSDTLADDLQRFIEVVAMEREPRQSQMIAVAKHRERKFAVMEGCEEGIVTQVNRTDCGRHTQL